MPTVSLHFTVLAVMEFFDATSRWIPYWRFHRAALPVTVSPVAEFDNRTPASRLVSVELLRTKLYLDVSVTRMPTCRFELHVLVSTKFRSEPESTMPLYVSDIAALFVTVLPWLAESLIPSPFTSHVLLSIVFVSDPSSRIPWRRFTRTVFAVTVS